MPPKLTHPKSLIFQISLLCLVLTTFLISWLASTQPYFFFDLTISRTVQTFNLTWFDWLMNGLTFLGNPWPATVAVLVTSFVFLSLKLRREAYFLVVSTSGAALLSFLLKTLVNRPRPDANLLQLIPSSLNTSSFPSGHVVFYVAFYGFLLFIILSKFKSSWQRDLAIITFSLMITLIGLSRIYLGAHWFSDVLGGYLIGCLCLYLMISVYKRRLV